MYSIPEDKDNKRGKFIVFEGVDGSGKTTLSKMVYDFLQSKGVPSIWIREPGTTKLGEEVRNLLFGIEYECSPLANLYLFSAARAQLLETVVRPALEAGTIIICDRYALSTLAYQTILDKVPVTTVEDIVDSMQCTGINPDTVIHLRVGPETAMSRSKNRADNNSFDEKAYHHMSLLCDQYDYAATYFHESTGTHITTIEVGDANLDTLLIDVLHDDPVLYEIYETLIRKQIHEEKAKGSEST